jgi:hypothetical protein
VLATLCLVGFLSGCFALWYHHRPGDERITLAAVQKNERRAYDHLSHIGEAQREYRRLSEDFLGRKTYAAFVTHLWTAVDKSGTPVKLELIPKKVALAVGSTKAVDGYYFIDIRQRSAGQGKTERTVDLNTQWCVAALPKHSGRTGNLVFLSDQSGGVFGIPMGAFRSRYPLRPESEGWASLPAATDLKAYQARLKYTLVAK